MFKNCVLEGCLGLVNACKLVYKLQRLERLGREIRAEFVLRCKKKNAEKKKEILRRWNVNCSELKRAYGEARRLERGRD